jgi:hypothetical protein
LAASSRELPYICQAKMYVQSTPKTWYYTLLESYLETPLLLVTLGLFAKPWIRTLNTIQVHNVAAVHNTYLYETEISKMIIGNQQGVPKGFIV